MFEGLNNAKLIVVAIAAMSQLGVSSFVFLRLCFMPHNANSLLAFLVPEIQLLPMEK